MLYIITANYPRLHVITAKHMFEFIAVSVMNIIQLCTEIFQHYKYFCEIKLIELVYIYIY